MPGTQLSPKEIAYIKQWRYDEGDGLAPSTIAIRLDRDKSTITRHLAMKSKGVWKKGEEKGRRGPARVLTKAKVATLLPKLEALVGKAKGEYEITSAMLKKSARVKVSARGMMKRLNEQEGTKWYRMRQKPTLTVVDVKDRFAFGKAYGGKNKRWWLKKVQLTIDVKFFPVFLNSKARSHVAQSGTRGVYRRKGQALTEGYYKPNPKLKYNTGAKGVHVLAGVGNGKVLLWEYIEGRWNSAEAVRLYKGPMRKVLQETYPHCRRYNVLEDNDPAGFRSKAGLQAKVDAKIDTFRIPKHSPQLNLCDYWLWKAVNTKMRATEKPWADGKKETRDAYLRRLKRSAQSLTKEEINHAAGSMKRRCLDLVAAKGGQIEG